MPRAEVPCTIAQIDDATVEPADGDAAWRPVSFADGGASPELEEEPAPDADAVSPASDQRSVFRRHWGLVIAALLLAAAVGITEARRSALPSLGSVILGAHPEPGPGPKSGAPMRVDAVMLTDRDFLDEAVSAPATEREADTRPTSRLARLAGYGVPSAYRFSFAPEVEAPPVAASVTPVSSAADLDLPALSLPASPPAELIAIAAATAGDLPVQSAIEAATVMSRPVTESQPLPDLQANTLAEETVQEKA